MGGVAHNSASRTLAFLQENGPQPRANCTSEIEAHKLVFRNRDCWCSDNAGAKSEARGVRFYPTQTMFEKILGKFSSTLYVQIH
jgi:hypothetical protein